MPIPRAGYGSDVGIYEPPVEEWFAAGTEGLVADSPPTVVDLNDGDHFGLHITPVAKRINDVDVRMHACNGSIPGPTLHVDQGSEVTVHLTNHGDLETTVHWHGLRMEDGDDVESTIPIGGSRTTTLRFPDPGVYWYHPRDGERATRGPDLQGAIVVEPTDSSYWPPVDRELTVTIGQFGDVVLVNGATELSETVRAGEAMRLFLVNTVNTRPFNLALRGASMKLLVGDGRGRNTRDAFVDEVVLAPCERAVVDVCFDRPGDVRLEHRGSGRVVLGWFSVVREVCPRRS